MSSFPLAAVYTENNDVDVFLGGIADTLRADGLRVCGALQTRGAVIGDCHCADMDLTTIGSNRVFRISQSLGNGSQGCRLHPGALAECSSFIERDLKQGADLLVLNRFGRGESEGRGFRDLIAKALELNVPVLTALRPAYGGTWAAFGADLACYLPLQRGAVFTWFADQMEGHHAA